MSKKGKNITNIAISNRALILKLIYTGKANTRVELSRATGLSKMTVGNIISSLIESNWVFEGGEKSNTNIGRNPVKLFPDEAHRSVIGVYISRDKIIVSSITPKATVSTSRKFYLNSKYTSKSMMEKIVNLIKVIIKEEGNKFMGIGVACIGPVDITDGILLSPPDFYNMKNIRIKEILEKEIGLTTVVNNDMNASALAELLYGKGAECNNFTYLGITHGIGAGIVLNGELYCGADGFSGELGHVSIDYNGKICACGNKGCIEAYASIPNFMSKVLTEAKNNECANKKNSLTFKNIIELVERKDEFANKMFDDFVSQISTALIACVHILNPKKIFIGHEGADGGELLAAAVESEISKRSFFKGENPIKVEISSFREDAPVIGSGVLFYNSIFSL